MTVLCAAILGLCRLCDTDLDKRGPQFLVMVGIIGGSYILAVAYDERIVTGYLGGYGYSRCHARDHRVGKGKGSVWFSDYVLHPADCPAER